MVNLTFTEGGYVYLYLGHWHTVQDNIFYTENGPVNIFFITDHDIVIFQIPTRSKILDKVFKKL